MDLPVGRVWLLPEPHQAGSRIPDPVLQHHHLSAGGPAGGWHGGAGLALDQQTQGRAAAGLTLRPTPDPKALARGLF
ncbi:hypothetical protein AERO8C_50323 [Aeromonas veronii]|uniref:Uncharacterized protein n=1 Tax=Aeromonas veronii TaxID=654 RepID=A0A653L9C8_AERVE|nr:hypothetical protein AERO8C_50323 [Aeromonas veronii]